MENSASLDAIPDNTKLFLLREKKPEPKLVALPSMRSFKVYTPKGEVKEESELLAEGFMIDGGKDGKKFKKKFFYMLSKVCSSLGAYTHYCQDLVLRFVFLLEGLPGALQERL